MERFSSCSCFFKKNDRLVYDNYRGISLLSVPGMVFADILLKRLKQSVESLLEAQCGFVRVEEQLIKYWLVR